MILDNTGAELTDSWKMLFSDNFQPHSYQTMQVEGEIPKDLVGEYHQMGPRNFQSFSNIILADGLLRSVRIKEGKAECAVSIVDAKAESNSVKDADFDQHGTYKSLKDKFKYLLKGLAPVKNVASTNVIAWGAETQQGGCELLGLFEVSKPTVLQSMDDQYKSLKESDLDGAIKGSFTAHPHWLPKKNCGYAFGQRFGLTGVQLDIYKLSIEESGRKKTKCIQTINLKRQCFGFIHDFAVTENYLIFCIPPVDMGLMETIRIARGESPITTPKCRPELGSKILVVPIVEPENYRFFEANPFFALHFANGYQTGNSLVFDCVISPDTKVYHVLNHIHKTSSKSELADIYPELYLTDNKYGRMNRVTLDLVNGDVSFNPLSKESVEFPRINSYFQGQPYRYIYSLSHAQNFLKIEPWFSAIRKFDLKCDSGGQGDLDGEGSMDRGEDQFYYLPKHHYALEPIFVRKQEAESLDEDDGYVLSCVLDAKTNNSYLLILDAKNLEKGPLAKLSFDQALPIAFHGNFFLGYSD